MPTATLPLVDAADIRSMVGPAAFERARPYARNGAVFALDWDEDDARLSGSVRGTGVQPYQCSVRLTPGKAGYWRPVAGTCSCPVRQDCKHVAAMLLAGNANSVRGRVAATAPAEAQAQTPVQAAWKTALGLPDPGAAGPLTGAPSFNADGLATAPLALQFELRETAHRSRGRWQRTSTVTVAAPPGATEDLLVAMRPVVRSKSGRWVTSNVGWGSLHYQVNRLNLDERQVRWFGQFSAVSRAERGVYLGQDPDRIILNDYSSPLLWNLLEEASALGIALVSTKGEGAVHVAHRATVALDASSAESNEQGARPGAGAAGGDSDKDGAGITLRTVVSFDQLRAQPRTVGTIGDHGLYTVEWLPGPTLTLAPTSEPLTPEERRMLAAPALHIPGTDVDEFLAEYYPILRQSIAITSTDETVQFPEIIPPVLVLTAQYEPEHVLHLNWEWEYRFGNGTVRLPLDERSGGGSGPRDPQAEATTRSHAAEELTAFAAGEGATLSHAVNAVITQAPASTMQTLRELDAAEFTVHALPVIQALPGIRVDIVGDKPDYRELTGTPTLTVTTVETDQRDWFDLGVIVQLQGRSIPFGPLFAALSKGATKLKLVDNSYLSLKQPVFDRLRELIAEAGELDEWETGPRINRYQASLWSDFEDLADESEPAAAWRATVDGLLALTETDAALASVAPLPAGLNATMRPYQLDGYAWLIFLWRHGLGGILADDMGLGKTLQTLALIAHARWSSRGSRSDPAGGAPFLVVAPTSVVSNWVSEAARFTPGLAVTAITKTQAKSGVPLASAWAEADIVVTSYTLFRLDFETYQSAGWAGLILDEAQFVKNHAAKAHRCARELNAPFKLAVTGTPMENNLTELWSLFAIVAPGLFPSLRRFTEQYLRPLEHEKERGDSSVLLAKLRRRIRPLMMRRTKDLVAPELPRKQEQVLQIELAPRHRKLYDTFLQRERQKLLGLIEDLDRNRFIVFRSLTLLRMLSLDASLVDEQYAAVPSSKLDALFEQLEDVLAEGHRTLIFSQFTTFLKKAADRLDARGVPYAYLDGSTRRRASVINGFKNGDAPVFLISLKAGGFGLNLTEADYVFLLDPWWNPATESQAVDRTHRIGQNKSVMVYRLVATGTIEEKVMALKAKKSRLFDAVLDDDAVFSSSLTADDIRGLLEG
jgi:superfamily II DNA or RNA helicase